MSIEVVDWSPSWAEQYDEVAAVLRAALVDVSSARVEHVGSTDLRDAYADVKRALAADPEMDIDTYIAGKSEVLQQVLEVSGELSDSELAAIRRLNDA